jgi:uroporphyrin-III C-methyltransferase/precorrin-2 dehydrogenase/sirohydrochlorin ferrochelatase
MAGGTAGVIAERLVEAGCSPTMPTVIVSNVSRGDERWAGSIADLGWASERRDPAKPVIIGVGRVFKRSVEAGGLGLERPLMLDAMA